MTKEDSKKRIVHRINRVEGQLGGIKRMIESETECIDIIAQVMAIREAITSLGIELLKDDLACRKTREIDEKYLKTLFKIK